MVEIIQRMNDQMRRRVDAAYRADSRLVTLRKNVQMAAAKVAAASKANVDLTTVLREQNLANAELLSYSPRGN